MVGEFVTHDSRSGLEMNRGMAISKGMRTRNHLRINRVFVGVSLGAAGEIAKLTHAV